MRLRVLWGRRIDRPVRLGDLVLVGDVSTIPEKAAQDSSRSGISI
jgi:hypothetical protein